MSGWISLHRQIKDHWLWKDKPFSKGQAWIDLLLLASHKSSKFPLGNELIEIERGSLITSELKLASRWGWSKTKVRAFLKLLEDDEMIVKKSDNKKTTINIVRYSDFQQLETTEVPQKNHGSTTEVPQKNTFNNVNNVNNDNKKEINSRKQVYDENSIYYKLANRFYQNILNNNPHHKEPNLQKWSDDIRKMIDIDKRTEEQVAYLIDWVQKDSFEMSNVLSPDKLRKRFDQLAMKGIKTKKIPKEDSDPRNKELAFQDWVEEGNDPDEFDWS